MKPLSFSPWKTSFFSFFLVVVGRELYKYTSISLFFFFFFRKSSKKDFPSKKREREASSGGESLVVGYFLMPAYRERAGNPIARRRGDTAQHCTYTLFLSRWNTTQKSNVEIHWRTARHAHLSPFPPIHYLSIYFVCPTFAISQWYFFLLLLLRLLLNIKRVWFSSTYRDEIGPWNIPPPPAPNANELTVLPRG